MCVQSEVPGRQPGQGALVAGRLALLGGGLLLREGLLLAELELRLREDVELEREAPVLDGVLLGAHGVLLLLCAVDGSSLTEAGELSPRPRAGACTAKQPERPPLL